MKSKFGICSPPALLLVSAMQMYSQKPVSAPPFSGFGPQNSIAVGIVALDNGPSLAGRFASLDLGRIAWGSKNSGAGNSQESTPGFTVITTRFGLQLSCPASLPRRSAELRVSLGPVPNGIEVLVDGRPIGPSATLLSGNEPCATTNAHILVIRIATSVLPGQFHYSVDFTATPT